MPTFKYRYYTFTTGVSNLYSDMNGVNSGLSENIYTKAENIHQTSHAEKSETCKIASCPNILSSVFLNILKIF